jgi:hypothetical protein
MSERTGQFLTEKELNISGLQVLNRVDILKELPVSKSVAWWLTNAREVEAALEKNVLVQKATVHRCSDFSLRCFEISIVERQPTFIAALGDRVWLIGEDGGFITPIPRKQFEAKGVNVVPGKTPILVEGLLSESVSPDLAKARIQYVKLVIGAVENELALRVSWVGLRDNGETALKFVGRDFEAVFDVADQDMGRVREESQRLKTVLSQLGDKAADVARIDLAFDKVAVVKLKNGATL